MTVVGSQHATALALPAINGYVVDLGVFYLVFGAFVITAAGNAVNLTDGLDGLAIVPVMIAAGTFGIIAYLAGNAIFSAYLGINFVSGAGELAVVCGAMIGAGLGFLWFNAPPAQIFMGDTGSLALGGLLGTIAVAVKHEIVLAIVGGLFVLEALSVIVQVVSYKLTGKRVFRMAPDPSSFRTDGLVRAAGRGPLLDHRLCARAHRPLDLEAEVTMIPLTFAAGQRIAVFGLGASGRVAARSAESGRRHCRSLGRSRGLARQSGGARADAHGSFEGRSQAVPIARPRAGHSADASRSRIGS